MLRIPPCFPCRAWGASACRTPTACYMRSYHPCLLQGLDRISLPPGSRILIHGGSGAVGSVAIQFAKRVKRWHVTATCSPANASYCR